MSEEQFDQIKYQNDYNKQKYDRINLMVPKGKKDELKKITTLDHAADAVVIACCIPAYVEIASVQNKLSCAE